MMGVGLGLLLIFILASAGIAAAHLYWLLAQQHGIGDGHRNSYEAKVGVYWYNVAQRMGASVIKDLEGR